MRVFNRLFDWCSRARPSAVLLAACAIIADPSPSAASPPAASQADPAARSTAAPEPSEAEVAVSRSPRVQIDFRVDDAAGPITAVEVWTSLDRGKSWRPAEMQSGAAAPAVFYTPHEGLHALYLVVHNTVGASAPPPQPGDRPHAWVFVDHTPPIVQVHSVERMSRPGEPARLVVNYSAYDDNLIDRPIGIDYLRAEQTHAEPVAARQPNDGRFEWTPPPAAGGRVRLRISARDRAGQVGAAVSAEIDLQAPAQADAVAAAQAPPLNAALAIDSPANLPAANTAAANDAVQLASPLFASAATAAVNDGAAAIALARAHAARGEWPQVELRYREALQRQPASTEARNGLAAALLRQGRLADAETEYRGVLHSSAKDPSALSGLAAVLAKRGDYAAARDVLRSLSAQRPDDPDVLLHLGDMFVLAGDPASGRGAWLAARAAAQPASAIQEQIRRRLLVYSAGSNP